ncbi:hypothetical protein KC678_00695 [Candidatus Dojkabacteria bacterium]|uniref:Uncharacterized protein n=1 Tax=Candidatus Dojkabacteria bacterium TaxID=2099670 RepID=A0A955IC84_9BACT|nr:hypothetical protein [Candidatus Dojkabacteria bacterium]
MSNEEKITIDKAFELNKKKKQKNAAYKKWVKIAKIYIIPILSIFVFLFILFGLTIPQVFNIFQTIGDIGDLNDKLKDKQKELVSVQGLNANADQLKEDLAILNSIAPTEQTEVVNFQQKISILAQEHNLVINSQQLNENTTGVAESFIESNELLYLRELPNVFEITGNVTDVFEFIDALELIDDFIVVNEMDLSAGEGNTWNMTVNLIKYQFSERSSSDELFNAYLQVPVTVVINSNVQDYLDKKRGSSTSDSNLSPIDQLNQTQEAKTTEDTTNQDNTTDTQQDTVDNIDPLTDITQQDTENLQVIQLNQ